MSVIVKHLPIALLAVYIVSCGVSRNTTQTGSPDGENETMFQGCHALAKAAGEELLGRVDFLIHVDARGVVTELTIKSSTIENPEHEKCAAEEVRASEYVARGEAYVLEYSFVFTP